MTATTEQPLLGHLKEPSCNCLQATLKTSVSFPAESRFAYPATSHRPGSYTCILCICYRISEIHRLSGAMETTVDRVVVTQLSNYGGGFRSGVFNVPSWGRSTCHKRMQTAQRTALKCRSLWRHMRHFNDNRRSVLGSSVNTLGNTGLNVRLTTPLFLVLKLRMGGVIHLPPTTCVPCVEAETFTFTLQ